MEEEVDRSDADANREVRAFRAAGRVLVVGERIIFSIIGLLLFLAAIALAWRSGATLMALFTGSEASLIDTAAEFLDLVLLILMIAELAYTVTLSVRVGVLSPEPFLIVGLIAVIRRILVITVQDVANKATVKPALGLANSSVEVALLTLVVIGFVFAIYLMRRSPR
jgi:hypothetical protein